MENIEQRVKKIVAEQLGVNEADIKIDSSFVDDLGADSLDTVELVMALEEEFECEIPDEEAEKITTVQQADRLHQQQSEEVSGALGSICLAAFPFIAGDYLVASQSRRYWLGAYFAGRQHGCRDLGEHRRRQERHRSDHPVRRFGAQGSHRRRGEGFRRRHLSVAERSTPDGHLHPLRHGGGYSGFPGFRAGGYAPRMPNGSA